MTGPREVIETEDPAVSDEAAQPCENVALAPAPQANSMPAESTLPPGQETPSRTTFVPRAARLPFSPPTTTPSWCGPAGRPVTVSGTRKRVVGEYRSTVR